MARGSNWLTGSRYARGPSLFPAIMLSWLRTRMCTAWHGHYSAKSGMRWRGRCTPQAASFLAFAFSFSLERSEKQGESSAGSSRWVTPTIRHACNAGLDDEDGMRMAVAAQDRVRWQTSAYGIRPCWQFICWCDLLAPHLCSLLLASSCMPSFPRIQRQLSPVIPVAGVGCFALFSSKILSSHSW